LRGDFKLRQAINDSQQNHSSLVRIDLQQGGLDRCSQFERARTLADRIDQSVALRLASIIERSIRGKSMQPGCEFRAFIEAV
jgi:hypothetical protein